MSPFYVAIRRSNEPVPVRVVDMPSIRIEADDYRAATTLALKLFGLPLYDAFAIDVQAPGDLAVYSTSFRVERRVQTIGNTVRPFTCPVCDFKGTAVWGTCRMCGRRYDDISPN